MALTDEELKQAKDYLIKEGVISVDPTGKINFENRNSVHEFPKIDLKNDSIDQVALKIWKRLDMSMMVGEHKEFIFPKTLLDAFLKAHSQYSEKFTFSKDEYPSPTIDGNTTPGFTILHVIRIAS